MAEITWLGHASFLIEGTRRVCIDPWKVPAGPPADLILISHDHYDHFSGEDIEKLRGPETVIITVPGVASQLSGRVVTVHPGEWVEEAGVRVEAIPAYNREKRFHPRERGWVGFLVTLDGERIYYAGDTDEIPEMDGLRPDVALLPVSGTYVMDAEEAARAWERLQPAVAIPYHYGEIVGSAEDARRFAALVSGEVRILEPHR